MKSTLFFAMLAAGISLATMASATNPNSCEHSQQQNQYHCNVGGEDGTNYVVSNVTNEADAYAAALAYANSASVSNATGGDADASASNGNQSMNVEAPDIPSLTANAQLIIDLADLGRMKTDNLEKVVRTIEEAQDKCLAAAVMNNSPALFSWITGKRTTISC